MHTKKRLGQLFFILGLIGVVTVVLVIFTAVPLNTVDGAHEAFIWSIVGIICLIVTLVGLGLLLARSGKRKRVHTTSQAPDEPTEET